MVYVFVLAIAAVVLGAAIFYAYDWYTMDRFTMSTNDFWTGPGKGVPSGEDTIAHLAWDR